MSEWISVKTRLPKQFLAVIVGSETHDAVDLARLEDCADWFAPDGHVLHNITHWMPLPPPPTPKENREQT